ncbi:MAG TPA: DUF2461 domain-containing protein [Clostridiales bacterium]|nr:DUF2461 domain-containing protein [Clostridiales bacterium]
MSFSKKTIDFIVENRLNDSKSWYQEHKEVYKQYVAEPFSEFITALQPTINEIDSEIICNPKRFLGGTEVFMKVIEKSNTH